MISSRLFNFRSLYCCAFSVLLQVMALAQTSVTPQTVGLPTPSRPNGPGEYYVGPQLPGVEVSMFIGAGEQVTGARPGGGGLPGSGGIHSYTGLVEGYLEIDNMDLANVDYTGSIGTLSVNGAVAANAPVNWGTDSAISTVSVNPSNGATFTFNGEVASCYFAAAPIGLLPPPIPPPCFYDCGGPGPELVSGQDPLQAGPAISDGPSFSVPAGVCVNANMPSLSVTYGFPHIVSISQQSANIGSTGSFTVTGTNLEDSEGTSSSSFNTSISSTVTTPGQSNETVSFSVPGTQTPGNYQFTISNIWGTSNGVSFTVPYPAATVTGISPSLWTAGQSYKGVQITGTNFGSTPKVSLSDPTITVSAPYNTTGTGISTTYIDLSVPLTTPSEPVIVTLTPGSGGTSFTQVPGGPSLPGSNTAAVLGLQQSACPAALDANSGFSAIAPTGLAVGGSGTMSVSFSSGSFNGNSVTVPYGPYSTPDSIASHVAAFITKNYHSSGLYAQSFGSYILYKSNTTLGTATLTASGSSFAADPSPAACPPVNLKYILAVTTDSVVWKTTPNGSQRGRQLTYVLVNKPTADTPVSSFQRVDPPNSITEYLTANGYSSSSNPNTGEFDDVLGNNSLCNCNSGVFKTYRYFTAIVNGQASGTVPIYDQTGVHKQDYIQITFPNGPSILNHWTNPDGTPKDISLP